MATVRDLIAALDLVPHPEGGWYRETYRAEAREGERPASTAILFLLEAGDRSHWHRVDADEVWVWQGGDPLALSIAMTDDAPPVTTVLGGDIGAGQQLQQVVPQGQWQAARGAADEKGYVLVSCIVAPGFDFAGFELAAAGWEPGA